MGPFVLNAILSRLCFSLQKQANLSCQIILSEYLLQHNRAGGHTAQCHVCHSRSLSQGGLSPNHLTLEHTWCSSSRHEGKKGGGGPCCSDLALSPALPPQRFFQHTWLVFPAKASSDSSFVPMAFAQIATSRPDSATRSLNSVLSRHSPHSFPLLWRLHFLLNSILAFLFYFFFF